MIKFLGSRGASAVLGMFMLAAGSSASAQNYGALNVPAAVRALDVNSAVKPLGTAAQTVANTVARPVVAATSAVATLSGTVLQTQPARSVTVSLSQSIATEAAWLYRAGWPLYALVDRYSAGAPLDEQGNCLATAVYFEARGESRRGSARGRPGGHEPRIVGTVPAGLVRSREAAGAILIRSARSVSIDRHRLGRMGPCPGRCPAGDGECRPKRRQ